MIRDSLLREAGSITGETQRGVATKLTADRSLVGRDLTELFLALLG